MLAVSISDWDVMGEPVMEEETDLYTEADDDRTDDVDTGHGVLYWDVSPGPNVALQDLQGGQVQLDCRLLLQHREPHWYCSLRRCGEGGGQFQQRHFSRRKPHANSVLILHRVLE